MERNFNNCSWNVKIYSASESASAFVRTFELLLFLSLEIPPAVSNLHFNFSFVFHFFFFVFIWTRENPNFGFKKLLVKKGTGRNKNKKNPRSLFYLHAEIDVIINRRNNCLHKIIIFSFLALLASRWKILMSWVEEENLLKQEIKGV